MSKNLGPTVQFQNPVEPVKAWPNAITPAPAPVPNQAPAVSPAESAKAEAE
jgi:hypothetical protein